MDRCSSDGADARLPDRRYELTKRSRHGLMHDGCRVCYPDLVPKRTAGATLLSTR